MNSSSLSINYSAIPSIVTDSPNAIANITAPIIAANATVRVFGLSCNGSIKYRSNGLLGCVFRNGRKPFDLIGHSFLKCTRSSVVTLTHSSIHLSIENPGNVLTVFNEALLSLVIHPAIPDRMELRKGRH
jgi:hypothetical protein